MHHDESSKKPAAAPPPLDCSVLEDRILYSATPLDPQLLEGEAPAEADDVFDEALAAWADPEASSADATEPADDAFLQWDDMVVETIPIDATDVELVFLDAGVSQDDALLQDLLLQKEGRSLEVIRIAADSDGVEQITHALQQRTNVAAVHLVSHGTDGAIQLGNTQLTGDSLDAYAGQISLWADALATGADVLIYGCDLAASEAGQDMVDALAALCDCDVAASDDITGNAALGGDWDLEYAVGTITTDMAFSAGLRTSWYGTLDITSDLVGHYEFDTTGPTTDSTGNQDASVSSGNSTGETPAAGRGSSGRACGRCGREQQLSRSRRQLGSGLR